MNKFFKILALTIVIILSSCIEHDPNTETNKVVNNRNVNSNSTKESLEGIKRKVYVPVYSNIYNGSKEEKVLLTATLSIRNTSEVDTLYLSRVAYFNTEGLLVRNYLKNPIFIKPLESIDYVIAQKDDLGGNGANFMIDWYSNKPLRPIFQCVMIGGQANRTFSFTTSGLEVN